MAGRSNYLFLSLAVLVCFFFSGLSGLIYEVVWTRLLLTVFGASIYAVSAALAAFMGGLALGSFLGGRLADRWSRPLLAYGILELGIAMVVLAVPAILRLFEPIFQVVYQTDHASYLNLSLLRFLLSFLTLLIPTTCMGATFPLLARFLVRRGATVGSRIGGLYAINTIGAVIGTFLAGFVLIAEFGVRGTTWIAAMLSSITGIVAIALSWRFEALPVTGASVLTEEKEAEGLTGPQLPASFVRLILVTYGIAGFVALAYQVFWTRTVIFHFEYLGNTTYAFGVMLTVLLIGLAAGSSLMTTLIDRRGDAVRLYGVIQILTGLAGAFSLYLITRSLFTVQVGLPLDTDTGALNWPVVVASTFLRTAIAIGPATFLMGMAFPVAARICVRQRVGVGTGRLYAVNTVGAILGSFAAGFVMIPLFGLYRGLLILGLLNVINGSLVLVLNPLQSRASRVGWGLSSLAVLAGLSLALPVNHRFGPAYLRNIPSFMTSIVDYREGPLATVAVGDDAFGYRRIFVDGVSVAGTELAFLTDQKSLAHTPMLLLKDPKSALTVGFGSGGASYSFLLYEELERLDCVEICETVPMMAHTLRESNHGVLDEWTGGTLKGRKFHNGRYRILIDDARSYLRFTDKSYDVIATDCTDIRYKSNANLYDVEYFTLCKNRLTDDGMVVVWFPISGLRGELFACAMKTFAHVFPHMTIWHMHNVPTHYLLLIGTKKNQPLSINIQRLRERISRPKIRQDLAEVWLHQPEKLLSCYVASAPDLINDWDEVTSKLNTEDFPFIEFHSPKQTVRNDTLYANLNILYRRHSSVSALIEDADRHPLFMERLERFEQAVRDILQGHLEYQTPDVLAARASYLRAARICPEDRTVKALLKFPEMRRIIEWDRKNIGTTGALAVVECLDGNIGNSKMLFDRILHATEDGRTLYTSRSGHFEKLVQALEHCYRSSRDPYFRILGDKIRQQGGTD